MRFPWSKPKTNTDGGPKTALFSFDRERERQVAAQYSAGREAWRDARYVLIDEVLAYRRTGVLAPSLLEACEAERAVASWPYSSGVRRLVELARDGHAEPAERLEALMSSKDWRVRYEALLTSFERSADRTVQLALARRALADRSGRIRSRFAGEAVFAHLLEMIPELEAAARTEPAADKAEGLFQAAWYLRRNARTGEIGRYGGGEDDRAAFEAAWSALRLSQASDAPPDPS